MMIKKKEMGLYIHIPFCIKKCNYCDFLSFQMNEKEMESYTEALLKELYAQGKRYKSFQVKTVFIGGGTPSLLPSSLIEKILKAVNKNFDLKKLDEYTIECNPGTLDRNKIKTYKKYGINRVSLGLQSTNENELRMLGRVHNFDDFLETFYILREEGFKNINVDLMSALPGQNKNTWEKTLLTVAALSPEHISAYSLILEEGTPFYDKYCEKDLPDEETDRNMYYKTKNILENMGYLRYEISNFSKAGFECRHNSGYWLRNNYLGCGLGASSMIENTRFTNTRNMDMYLSESSNPESIRTDFNTLTIDEQMEEYMFLGLRMTKGISTLEFEKVFKIMYNDVYGEITRKLIIDGFMEENEERLYLTKKGIDVSNIVLSNFIKN